MKSACEGIDIIQTADFAFGIQNFEAIAPRGDPVAFLG